GQPVMELETDKAVVEVPSSVAGIVKDIRVKEGDKLNVGQVIFTVENGASAKSKPAEIPVKPPRQTEQPSETNAATDTMPASPIPAPSIPTPQPRTSGASEGTATEFRLPELGENIEQGDLVRLMVAPGAKVSEGQPVMELETDKAVVEVPSSVSGVVKDVRVKEGDKLKVGQVIFTLEGGAVAQPNRAKPAPVAHVSHFKQRSRRKGRPSRRRFLPICRFLRRRFSACQCNWRKSLELNIVIQFRRLPAFGGWRASLESTSTR